MNQARNQIYCRVDILMKYYGIKDERKIVKVLKNIRL
jgi:hypothetical protein